MNGTAAVFIGVRPVFLRSVRRGPEGASLVEARYEYYDNSLPKLVTHYNADGVTVNGRVAYTYYDNNLVHEIDHQKTLSHP